MKNSQEQNFDFARGITLDTRVTGFKTNLFSIAIIQKFFYSIGSAFASRLRLPGRAGGFYHGYFKVLCKGKPTVFGFES
jgi:hypothetical protein